MRINRGQTGNRSLPVLERDRGLARRYLRRVHPDRIAVVIAIIGALAALTINVLPSVDWKQVRNRVKVELNALKTAIESYKEKQGFYPPGQSEQLRFQSLFYALVGHGQGCRSGWNRSCSDCPAGKSPAFPCTTRWLFLEAFQFHLPRGFAPCFQSTLGRTLNGSVPQARR